VIYRKKAAVLQDLNLVVAQWDSSKHQAPTSRETSSSDHQAWCAIGFDHPFPTMAQAQALELWCLEILWMLELGFWCFRPSSADDSRERFSQLYPHHFRA